MSGGAGAAGSAEGTQDPSMEEILASIRRILSEDESAAAAAAEAPAAAPAVAATPLPGPAPGPITPHVPVPADDILDLDPGMLVQPVAPIAPPPAAPAPAEVAQATAAEPLDIHPEPAPAAAPDPFDDLPALEPPPEEIAPSHDATDAMVPALMPLVAPEAAEAAAQSLGSLARRLAAERATAVHRGGPTIEDLVREEIRPLLKEWLDTHLPPMVERMVRAEIERVTSLTQL